MLAITNHDKGWYVVRAANRSEKAVGEEIEKLGYNTFVPIMKVRSKRYTGQTREYALFSGYGFVELDIAQPGWGAILEIKKVYDFLRMNGDPVRVPEHAISALQLGQSIGMYDRTKPPSVGKEVQYIDGPLRDMIGKIASVRSDKRVDVLIKGILGSDRVVTSPLAILREM